MESNKPNSTNAVAEPIKSTALATVDKTIADKVLNRVKELADSGRLHLPADYSAGNALSSAWLQIVRAKDRNGQSALDVVTKESIANTLLEMAILGLSMAKKQCYPIVYGKELTCFVSVWGKIAAISRLKGVESQPVAALIYEGDEVEIGFTEEGEMEVKTHKTSWANVQSSKITGAYASVVFKGQKRTAVLPMKEILEAWSKSQADKLHQVFTGEFCKRTALNRLAKVLVNTSTDDDIIAETLDENESRNFDFEKDPSTVVETVKAEVKQNTGTVAPPIKPNPIPLSGLSGETLTGKQVNQITDEEADKRMNENTPPPGQTALPIDSDLPF